jgi:Protein of unknown function (DUF2786)
MAMSVIEKIAKLRRLAQSANLNEAAAAAAAADRLMQEHGIAEAQLEAAGEMPKESPVEESTPLAQWVGGTPQWELSLVTQLARHYGCSTYGSTDAKEVGPNQWRDSYSTHVVGRPSDIASVRYMYAWLKLEIERLAKINAGNGRAWINSFKHGAVAGVLEAMRAAKASVMAETKASASSPTASTSTSAALVLIDNRAGEAKAARDALHPNLRSGGRIGGASSAGGYGAGKTAGSRLGTTHKSMASGGVRSLPAGK